MAAWTICRALELLNFLPADRRETICTRLNITTEELTAWDTISRKMFVPMMKDGVISQFEGYEDLEEWPFWKDGEIDRDALQRALTENGGYLDQYKISKQADVLMLNYLFSPTELQELMERLGYSQQAAFIEANIQYYIPRTANDSTLSRVAHVWALSRVNRLLAAKLIPGCANNVAKASEKLFLEALGSDYYDVATRGTAKNGIHMGAMAGTVDIVQRCITGMVARGDVLWIDPLLPKQLLRLSFTLRYRGQSLSFDFGPECFKVSAWHLSARPVRIGFQTQTYELNAGESKVFQLAQN